MTLKMETITSPLPDKTLVAYEGMFPGEEDCYNFFSVILGPKNPAKVDKAVEEAKKAGLVKPMSLAVAKERFKTIGRTSDMMEYIYALERELFLRGMKKSLEKMDILEEEKDLKSEPTIAEQKKMYR